jgi:hypothetical protein
MDIAKKAEKLIVDNSPTILTALGVTGAITTAYLTGRSTFIAAEIIADEQAQLDRHPKGHELELKEKFQLVWKLYIPPVGTGVLTIACIVFANHIGTRRATALAAAYSISEKAITEYKDKVVERFGMDKEQMIRDEISQDRVDRNPVNEREVIITGNGEVLCYDEMSGRYFRSDMETLKKAQNDINYKILNDTCTYASLGDFYKMVGLEPNAYSEAVGWTLENMLELNLTTTLSKDQRPCISVGFQTIPVRDYHKLG